MGNFFLKYLILSLLILNFAKAGVAQILWTNTGTATNWYGATNWTPNTTYNAWLPNDIAQFNDAGTATTAGIDMSQGSLSIGAIKVTNLRTRTLTIGNSSATPGTLTLNGDASNVILSQHQGNLLTSSHIILQDNETGSGKVMNIALANTENFILLNGLSSGISISSAIGGVGKKITLGGANGVLTLSGTNTYTGLTTCNIQQGYMILNKPGGGTLPAGNDVYVSSGTLEINTDQTLHDVKIGSGFLTIGNGATLTITGTLSRSSGSGGVVTSGTGKIIYAPGASLEYTSSFLGGSISAEFPNIDGPTNLTLSGGSLVNLNVGSRTIPGLLSLDGALFLNSNDLTCANLISAISGRVVTNGTGRLIISNVGIGPVTFPISTGSSALNFITISNGGGLSYAVRVAAGITPAIVNSNTAVNRTWFIQPSLALSSPVNVSFNYSNTDGNVGFSYSAPIELGQFTSAWNVVQTNITQTQPLPTTIASMAGNVENAFIISNVGAVLASGKIDIAVQKQNNNGYLLWSIENIADLVKLEIERSADSRDFSSLSVVNTTSVYFEDNKLLTGINYYRLKLTNTYGKVTYSTIVALLNKESGFDIVGLSPTLVSSNAVLNVTAAQKTKIDVLVTDIAGKQVQKLAYNLIAGSNQFTLNFAGLSAGTYQITGYTADGTSRTVRFVKQ